MTTAKNPYRTGGPCYLAWEAGYYAALDDVEALEGKKAEATDRDIPTKPVHRGYDQEEFFCGKCGMHFHPWEPHTFCARCGQKIDMSEYEQ